MGGGLPNAQRQRWLEPPTYRATKNTPNRILVLTLGILLEIFQSDTNSNKITNNSAKYMPYILLIPCRKLTGVGRNNTIFSPLRSSLPSCMVLMPENEG